MTKARYLEFLRSLGLIQFFSRFIDKFSEISVPLTDLTKKGQGIYKWDGLCEYAFASLKESIKSDQILAAPDWKKPLRGHVDASQLAVEGYLTQLDEHERDRMISLFQINHAEKAELYSR